MLNIIAKYRLGRRLLKSLKNRLNLIFETEEEKAIQKEQKANRQERIDALQSWFEDLLVFEDKRFGEVFFSYDFGGYLTVFAQDSKFEEVRSFVTKFINQTDGNLPVMAGKPFKNFGVEYKTLDIYGLDKDGVDRLQKGLIDEFNIEEQNVFPAGKSYTLLSSPSVQQTGGDCGEVCSSRVLGGGNS